MAQVGSSIVVLANTRDPHPHVAEIAGKTGTIFSQSYPLRYNVKIDGFEQKDYEGFLQICMDESIILYGDEFDVVDAEEFIP